MSDPLPIIPHLTSEFYLWLWYSSDTRDQQFRITVEDEVQTVELWVEDRIAFRNPMQGKIDAVMTGESASSTPESFAAVRGGKCLEELRIGLRRDDREFFATLKGSEMTRCAVVLPSVLSESEDEIVYDRMFLWAELEWILDALYRMFARDRLSPAWKTELVPAIVDWSNQ